MCGSASGTFNFFIAIFLFWAQILLGAPSCYLATNLD
jgi:hypothetical protein